MTDHIAAGNTDAAVPSSVSALLGRRRTDADGNDWVRAYSTTTLVAGTPYMLIESQTAARNPSVIALATNTGTAQHIQVCVPGVGAVEGDTLDVQVAGEVEMTVASATYAKGHGLKVHDGVVTSMGAAYGQLANEFGMVAETQATTATTRLNAVLIGNRPLSTT